MFNSRITALAKYLPRKKLTNNDLSQMVDTSDEWIKSRTGIETRFVSDGENTSDLCTNVSKQLLNKTEVLPEEVDLIIVATVSPDYLMPSTACILQSNIGAVNAFAFDINVACSGFVFALSVADKYIKSGLVKKAIVIGAETLSKHIDWNDRSTCVLFGDGAGGALITATEENDVGIISEDLHSDGTRYNNLTSMHMPVITKFSNIDSSDSKYMQMDGREILGFATKNVPISIKKVLLDKSIDEIKYIVPHQANAKIIDIISRKLNINKSKFYMNIDKFANTSAASIPIALAEMFEDGLLQYESKDEIIITGFGAGLTWGSMLIKI